MSDWDEISGLYIDRAGNKISLRRFCDLSSDETYRHVRYEYLPGKGGALYYVSTIWTGVDMSFWGRRPLMLETMAFDGNGDEYDGSRYGSDYEAFRGHDRIKGRIAQEWWTDLGGRAC